MNQQKTSKKKKEKKKVNRAVARELNKGKFGDMILRSSTYFGTLTDPFNVHGSKIPDLVTYPSTAFSIVDRRTLTVNAAGIASMALGIAGGAVSAQRLCGLVPLTDPSGVSDYYFGMTGGANAALNNLFPSTSYAPMTLSEWSTTSPTVPSNFNKARLVSCGYAADYLGSVINQKGLITVASAPRRFYSQLNEVAGITLTDVQKIPSARTIPIAKNQGVTALYHPQDNVSLEYCTLSDTPTVNSYNDIPERNQYGELYFVASGATVGDTIQVTIVLNYEGIPNRNTFNLVSPETSYSDPLELSAIMNRVDDFPKTFQGTAEASGLISGNTQLRTPPANSAMTMTTPQLGNQAKGDSITEKILGGADSLSRIVDKGLELGKKVAPLAEIALSLL